MDMLTLAMAKAYTDKKVGGGGGGSGGGLPMVELTTMISSNQGTTELTAEDSAKLTEAASKRMPCIITFNAGGTHLSYIFGFFKGTVPLSA